jgi:hypothetical protein
MQLHGKLSKERLHLPSVSNSGSLAPLTLQNSSLLKRLVLVALPLLFAYLELGGNWFAYRLLERRTAWSISGVIVFSVLYSIVAAYAAKALRVDLKYLMINYGFGFTLIATVLELEWGKLPALTVSTLRQNRDLYPVVFIAALGFLWSFVILLRSPSVDEP